MSKISFEKTVADLLECYKRMQEQVPESGETAKRNLIRLCKQISEEYGEK